MKTALRNFSSCGNKMSILTMLYFILLLQSYVSISLWQRFKISKKGIQRLIIKCIRCLLFVVLSSSQVMHKVEPLGVRLNFIYFIFWFWAFLVYIYLLGLDLPRYVNLTLLGNCYTTLPYKSDWYLNIMSLS